MRAIFARVVAVVPLLLVAASGGCASSPDASTSATEDHLEASAVAIARFTPHIASLKSKLESGRSIDEIAEGLLGSGRPDAFDLQALCRLYKKADPKFGEMQRDFKGLEDGIGEYGKWYEIVKTAQREGRDAGTLARLAGQKADALAAFKKLLTDARWLTEDGSPTRLQAIEAFLKGFDWKTRRDDRRLVLARILDEAKEIGQTTYDMKILEHGDGVHELRRDVRWILYEQRVLNGMITLQADACPIPAYANAPKDDYYSALAPNPNEPSPCRLSQCLVFQAASVVSQLGGLKDKAEREVNIQGTGDVVPVQLQPAAQAVYADMVANDLMGVYAAQLKACRDAP